jgi:lysozyme
MADPTNVVIDISHHNGDNLDFVKAREAGIVGVIHKATQGFLLKDKKYETNRKKALDAGLLWGAYHFAVGGDGSDQADFF